MCMCDERKLLLKKLRRMVTGTKQAGTKETSGEEQGSIEGLAMVKGDKKELGMLTAAKGCWCEESPGYERVVAVVTKLIIVAAVIVLWGAWRRRQTRTRRQSNKNDKSIFTDKTQSTQLRNLVSFARFRANAHIPIQVERECMAGELLEQ